MNLRSLNEIFSFSRKPYFVRLGDQNLATNEDGAGPADYEIDQIITHPGYNPRFKENDIALIKLKTEVVFTEFVRPACLYQDSKFIGDVLAVRKGLMETSFEYSH